MKKLIPLLLLPLLVLAGCTVDLSTDEAREKAESFINDALMQGTPAKATVKEVTKENGIYKITVEAGGQTVDSYLTPDGKLFFPQAMDIDEIEGQIKAMQTPPEPAEPAPKQEKANVELFVMSHCPYGTQIEKGILPVLETLGDKVDFELKFCDYVMHGEKEIDEQLNQVCIQEQGRDKLISYLKCFLKEGKGEECVTEAGVNKAAMDACVAKKDSAFGIKADFADQETWRSGRFPVFPVFQESVDKYSVGGSPTLVINGQTVSAGRDSAGLLKAICDGFAEPPEECNTELESTPPSPGFGFEGSGSGAEASCE